MARPKKTGLEYFPLDVDMAQDDKIELIEAEHGLVGFGIVVRIYMLVYKNGYFYNWTKREQLLLSKRINVHINILNKVINDCIKWELFDSAIYENHKILTSKGIQTRYLAAVGRRKKASIRSDYLLLSEKDLKEFKNISIEVVNVNTNPTNEEVNDNINPQSKVKESKVKESKLQQLQDNNNNISQEDKNIVVDVVEDDNLITNNSNKDIYQYYVKNMGRMITPIEVEGIDSYVEILGEDIVKYAIEIAVFQNARKFAYIKSILQSWVSSGYKTLQEIIDAETKREECKSTTGIKRADEVMEIINGVDK